MKLSVSLKIFLGFIAIVVAFSAAAVFEILQSRRVQEDLRRLNQVYLRLNDVYRSLDTRFIQLNELHRNSRDILMTSSDSRSRAHVTRYMPLVQDYRRKRLEEIASIARSGLTIDLPSSDRRFLEQVIEATALLTKDFAAEDRIYEEVFVKASASTSPERMTAGTERMLREMTHSRKRLRQVGSSLRQILSRNLTNSVRRTAQRMEDTESITAIYSMALTLFALVLALAMMLLAHFTLKPLQVLRQGARVIGKGDYNHRVRIRARDEIGELAQEFNAMADAIQEREQRLIQSERKAARAERLATVGHAAAQITHEVRNPLSAIQLNAEMLEDELETLSEAIADLGDGDRMGEPRALLEARSLLSAIHREVDRLTEVTESYLQFARLPRPRLEEDDLGQLIESVFAFQRGELEGAGIAVELQIAPLPTVAFDENLIRQAILNLMRNAMQAMPSGGTLSIRAEALPERVEVSLSDTGVGMDPEGIKHIFDPFFTTKEKGTGLGLTITSQILEEHGGTIRAERLASGGMRFVLSLPLASVARPPVEDSSEPSAENGATVRHHASAENSAESRPGDSAETRVDNGATPGAQHSPTRGAKDSTAA